MIGCSLAVIVPWLQSSLSSSKFSKQTFHESFSITCLSSLEFLSIFVFHHYRFAHLFLLVLILSSSSSASSKATSITWFFLSSIVAKLFPQQFNEKYDFFLKLWTALTNAWINTKIFFVSVFFLSLHLIDKIPV